MFYFTAYVRVLFIFSICCIYFLPSLANKCVHKCNIHILHVALKSALIDLLTSKVLLPKYQFNKQFSVTRFLQQFPDFFCQLSHILPDTHLIHLHFGVHQKTV